MDRLIAYIGALVVGAILLLYAYSAFSIQKAQTPYVELGKAVAAKQPIQLPDYISIMAYPVHYEPEYSGLKIVRYKLAPGTAPPNCADCLPFPGGQYYAVVFGATQNLPYGYAFGKTNFTIVQTNSLMVLPYFDNGRVVYYYPMCKGGFGFEFREMIAETTPPTKVILIYCK